MLAKYIAHCKKAWIITVCNVFSKHAATEDSSILLSHATSKKGSSSVTIKIMFVVDVLRMCDQHALCTCVFELGVATYMYVSKPTIRNLIGEQSEPTWPDQGCAVPIVTSIIKPAIR